MTNFGCDSQKKRAFTPPPKQVKEIRPTWIHHLGKESKPIQKTQPLERGVFFASRMVGISCRVSISVLCVCKAIGNTQVNTRDLAQQLMPIKTKPG